MRHLRMFLSVCEMGSINLAASAMNVAQPGITQAIANLEKRFDAKLLTRRAGGSFPTEEGEILRRRVERFLRQLTEAVAEAPNRTALPDKSKYEVVVHRITAVQLRALVAVARHGSVNVAAQSEGLSVSSMHHAARDIESNVDYALYMKNATGLSVNRAGRELARRVQLAISELAQADDEIASHSGGVRGRVLIGSLPMIRSALLGLAINKTLARMPGLHFEVLEGVYPSMLGALRRGDVDVLIGALRSPAPANDVREEFLFEDPYAVIVRAGHPLAGQTVSLDQLMAAEWVTQKPGTPVRTALDAIFAASGATPHVTVETASMVLTRSVLLTSDRLTLLSRRQIAVEMRAGLLTALDYTVPAAGRMIGVTTRTDWLPSLGQTTFLQCLNETIATEIHASDD
ncbi:LysR substrate-binding domain-containing protein [Rhizobium halophytocola]|uniref:LysR substrate-binding domain-containing protein n=1 Tax=Rhizobium halophytocola TaxID=735519 RepID=UPI002476E852|nr:LysR substrate-binding domain-containing protein [Rhizobium halophytocola]